MTPVVAQGLRPYELRHERDAQEGGRTTTNRKLAGTTLRIRTVSKQQQPAGVTGDRDAEFLVH